MPDCPYCGEMHSPMMKCSAQRKGEAVKTALAVTSAKLRQLRLRLQLRNLCVEPPSGSIVEDSARQSLSRAQPFQS
jgi:hypothetical protein